MLDNFIHMTQGELLIEYWWLWLIIAVLGAAAAYFSGR